MKKLFFLFATVVSLAACSNNAGTVADQKDSLDSIANAKKEMIDSTAEQKKERIDSTTDNMKNTLEKTDSTIRATTGDTAKKAR